MMIDFFLRDERGLVWKTTCGFNSNAKSKKAKRGEYLLLHEEVISVIIDRLYDKKDNNVVLVQNKPTHGRVPLTVTSNS